MSVPCGLLLTNWTGAAKQTEVMAPDVKYSKSLQSYS